MYFGDVLANHSQMLCVHSTDEVFTIDVTSVDSHFPYLCATADLRIQKYSLNEQWRILNGSKCLFLLIGQITFINNVSHPIH